MRFAIVTQDIDVLIPLRELLEANSHETMHSTRASFARQYVEREDVDVLIADHRLADGNGLDLIESLRESFPAVQTALTASSHQGKLRLSQARRAAAFTQIPLPIERDTMQRLMQQLDAERQSRAAACEPRHSVDFHGMYGSAQSMLDCYRTIRRVGGTHATVLVTGESGTGKELVAHALHAESPRRARPFVAVNCSALPSELVESELFGHEKGAFTGAVKDRGGLFEEANGGTLFLDEIGDLGERAQAKVLRALESGEVARVGSGKTTRVDVRIIAATNRPLETMVSEGTFREDLLYRLKVVPVRLPPLRERGEDVPMLAARFLAHFEVRHCMRRRQLSQAATAALIAHHWPGNVRELRNAMEYALLMADGAEIMEHDLPSSIRSFAGVRGGTVERPERMFT